MMVELPILPTINCVICFSILVPVLGLPTPTQNTRTPQISARNLSICFAYLLDSVVTGVSRGVSEHQ